MIINCSYCNASFKPKFFASTRKKPKYCTRICMAKSFEINIKKKCETCNEEYTEKKRNQKFCSWKCIRTGIGPLIKYMRENPKKSWWDTATEEQKLEKYKYFFESKVIKKDGCWDWRPPVDSTGSGYLGPNGHKISSYRASWLIYKDPIKDKLWVLHKCDNRRCSNPEHLYLGTAQDNVNDKMARNRGNFNKQNSKNAKLTKESALEVKKLLNEGFTQKYIADKYKVHQGTIQNIKDGRTWKDV